MADEQKSELSAETLALAAVGRGEEAPAQVEDNAQDAPADAVGAGEVPEWVPEKFRKEGKADYESLAKAYAELEKKLGQPKEAPGGDDEGAGDAGDLDDDNGGLSDGDGDGDAASAIPAELFSSAQAEWAESGDLSAETREKIISSGIPAETLETYLAGVKALSDALTQSVYNAAGGEDDYRAAIEWARENWSGGKVEKFDAALTDADLMPTMVTALMTEFRTANPGEGTQTRPGGGVDHGDVYSDPEEFTRDLQEATMKNDPLLRQKAVKKLERSKKAGTVKSITPRTGVSQLL